MMRLAKTGPVREKKTKKKGEWTAGTATKLIRDPVEAQQEFAVLKVGKTKEHKGQEWGVNIKRRGSPPGKKKKGEKDKEEGRGAKRQIGKLWVPT